MENFSTSSRLLPGIGPAGASPTGPGSIDMGMIPGFDVISKLFTRLGLDTSLLVTLGMSFTLITSLLSFFTYSFGSLRAIVAFISQNLTSSATIHSTDVTYLYVMRWLNVNKVSTDCRLFCVTSRKNPQSYAVRRFSNYSPYGDGNRSPDDDEDEDQDDGHDALGARLRYTPAPGHLYFWYKHRPIFVNRKLDLTYYTGDIPDETIVLTTVGRSPNFLREILSEARRDYLQARSRKTTVYTLSQSPFSQKNWDQGRHRPSRDISTVIMPQEEKDNILTDVREYLNPATMRWYAQRGLPYRRGYLFYGPPGTGKTSLSLALAGELKLPLYILSLSTGSLTDETLTMLFVGLPRKCIVLLEDIDCAGVYREKNSDGWDADDDSDPESEDEDTSSEKDTKKWKKGTSSATKKTPASSSGRTSKKEQSKKFDSGSIPSRRPRSSVSFSGLLNAIDGVASHEGRILIMTTNHRERLDSALIRPGRVDVQIEFGYADRETLAEIFRELYKEIGCMTNSAPGSEKRKTKASLDKEDVNRLAEDFADKIPAKRFTPAEIQGFLMSYKGQPAKALEFIDGWVQTKTKNEMRKKAKADKKKCHRKSPSSAADKPPQFDQKNTLPLQGSDDGGHLATRNTSQDSDGGILTPDNSCHSFVENLADENGKVDVKCLVQLLQKAVRDSEREKHGQLRRSVEQVSGAATDIHTPLDENKNGSSPNTWHKVTKISSDGSSNGSTGVDCSDSD